MRLALLALSFSCLVILDQRRSHPALPGELAEERPLGAPVALSER